MLFCNRAETISDVLTSASDDHDFPTDHYIIEFSICTKFTRAKPVQRVIYDYNHADFPALRRALSEAPLDIPLTDNIDDCWEQWKDKFLSVVTSSIPTHIVQDINSPPWIDGEVRHLIRKKYTALRKYRKNKTAERKLKLRTLCQQVELNIKCTSQRSKLRSKITRRCSGNTIKQYFTTILLSTLS